METSDILPAAVPQSPAEEELRQGLTETMETLPAPVLPAPVLEKIRREQQASKETATYRDSRAAKEAKFRREQEAFRKLLPELLRTHRDQYVAIHEGHVVGRGPDQIELADRAYERFGHIPILVTLVTDHPSLVRFRPRA